jgi:hypothetical protein
LKWTKIFKPLKVKYKELEGMTAKEYLDKAKTMFEKMDLQ